MNALPAIPWEQVARRPDLLALFSERGARWVRVHAEVAAVRALAAWQDDGTVSDEELEALVSVCVAARRALGLAVADASVDLADAVRRMQHDMAPMVEDALHELGPSERHPLLWQAYRRVQDSDRLLYDAFSRWDGWRPGPRFDDHMRRVALFDALLLLLAVGEQLLDSSEGTVRRDELGAAADEVARQIEQSVRQDLDGVLLPAVGELDDAGVPADPPDTGLSAEDLRMASEVAVDLEQVRLARDLLDYAVALHPHHEPLARLHAVVQPPVVRARRPSGTRGAEGWAEALPNLRASAERPWVVLRGAEVVATCATYVEAASQAEPSDVVTRVSVARA